MLFEPVLIVLIRGLHLLMNKWQAKMFLNPLSSFLGVARIGTCARWKSTWSRPTSTPKSAIRWHWRKNQG